MNLQEQNLDKNQLFRWPEMEQDLITPLPFNIEKIDNIYWREIIRDNFGIVLIIGSLYLFLIHWGKNWMKNRAPFKLKKLLTFWNLSLAIFSFICVWRTSPEFFYHLSHYNYNMREMYCKREGKHSVITSFWGLLFVGSKLIEFGDTAFLILRKKPLIFLHWFHHLVTYLMSFYLYPSYEPLVAIESLQNALVHFFMYTYFFLMSIGFKVNKKLAMCLTIVQMFQFGTTITATIYLLIYKLQGNTCVAASYETLWIHLFVIVTYLVLFGRFFVQTHLETFVQKKKVD